MEYRQLGRSGLRISTITLGTMGFGGGGVFAKVGTGDVQDARRQIDMALEAGVNMIDTADIYSMGKTEEIVGEALGSRRDDVILATKARFPMGDAANDADRRPVADHARSPKSHDASSTSTQFCPPNPNALTVRQGGHPGPHRSVRGPRYCHTTRDGRVAHRAHP